jgi:hypothetical protein
MKKLRLIVFVMLIGFGAAIIGVTALAQSTPAPPNPFLAYADVFPGQPASAIEARPFSCQQDYDHVSHPEQTNCKFTPATGVFSSVQAIISEGIVYQLTLTMRDTTLQVGDLEVLLKMPTRYTRDSTAYFFLPGSIVTARTADNTRQFSLFLSIRSVSFTRFTK